MTRVRLCAQLAQIHADIERMPMGYESLVGDMGSTLIRAGSPFYNSD
jgi:ATP-binding cassette subfamily B protein RaxB